MKGNLKINILLYKTGEQWISRASSRVLSHFPEAVPHAALLAAAVDALQQDLEQKLGH